MDLYEVIYVSFIFVKDDDEVKKTKSFFIIAKDQKEAKKIFIEQKIKHKEIYSIEKSLSNTLGNICPELAKLKNNMNED